MKRFFTVFSTVFLTIVLTSCTGSLQKVEGTLGYAVNKFAETCSESIGTSGVLTNGAGEVLGTIRIISVELPENVDDNFNYCTANLEALDINLSGDVLQVEFSGTSRWSGKWILNKSDFESGRIQIAA